MAATQTWAAMVSSADRDAPAVVSATDVLTRRDLLEAAAGAVGWLDENRVRRGATIAALLPSSRDAFALALAGALSERPLAPLNPRATVRELVGQLAGLDCEVLVVVPGVAVLGAAVAEAAGCRLLIASELPCSPAETLPADVAPTAPVVVVHTSGTTGRPKPVTIREDRLAARTRCFADIVRFGPGSVFTSGSPFHHIAGVGIFLTALAAGAALAEFPGFSTDAWSEMEALGVTHALLVPTMIEQLLDAGRLGIPTLRSLQYGAAPIRPETVRRLARELPEVRLTQLYGQTEGSPITALTHEHHLIAAARAPGLLGSVGTAVDGLQLRVQTPDDRGVGELLARAAHLFTSEDDGWLHTGDLGRIDEQGFVHLLGRKGDMIIRGGENVYPHEVECVIAEHPGVRDVAVVGIPDRRSGETVKAIVVLWTGATASAEELHAHTRAALSGYKVPAEWDFVAELPRNAAGKVVRTQLRQA